MGGSREPVLPWRLSVFRERVEPRSTVVHQEQADGGCSRAKACAVRFQRNVRKEERKLSPEGPRVQASALGHHAPPGTQAASGSWCWDSEGHCVGWGWGPSQQSVLAN